ncbi:gametocyte-specific factor 1 homolog [Bacillus rossius redtenbacheri]|uniref:gametocyte-specific factor 1 homolog n=1 Tax=Bacillus rossius redtenbacheri TaxID=93214 RepID=UPI002FDD2727
MAGATRSITLSSNIRLQTTREYMPEDPDDPLKQCPLEPAHWILSSRLALHLVKCREAQTKKIPLTQCKFDSTHWVLKKDLVFHMAEECDKRELFERYAVHADDPLGPAPGPPPELPQFEEDWDDGPAVCYDPTLKAENEAVLRIHSVASKKERKRFRNDERRRLQELEREGKPLSGTQAVNPPARLRSPHQAPRKQLPHAVPPADVTQSLAQLSLDRAPPKKDNAWVSVSKGRRKGGKKQ